MNTKKTVALILALILALTLFAGCGTTNGSASKSAQTETSAEATEAPPAEETSAEPAEEPTEEPTEVPEVSGVTYPLASPDEGKEFDVFMAIAGFIPMVVDDLDTNGFNSTRGVQIMEAATGVHLNWTLIDQDAYSQQFQIMIASGEYPDIMGAPTNYYTGGIDAIIADEVCIDIAPYLESCLPDFKADIYDTNELYAKAITSDTGKIATIFAYEEQSTQGLIIRQDWLDKVGMEIPTTYDELHDVLAAFKTDIGAKNPMVISRYFAYSNSGLVGGYETSSFGDSSNLAYYVDNGTVKAGAISDNYKEYLMMLNQWWTEGLIGDVSLNIYNEQEINDYIYDNSCGFWQGQSDGMSETAKSNAGGDFNAQPMQQVVRNEGDTFKLFKNDGQKNPSGGWGVSAQCEDPETVLKLINWFWTEEGFIACNYGEEGVTYNMVDGEVQFTDLILNNPNGKPALFNSCSEIIFFDLPFRFSLTRKSATLTNQAEIDSQTVWRTGTSNEMYYPDTTLTTEETEKYSALFGDAHTYASENITKFITGEKSFDEWDAYVDKLIELGIEDLVALKQSAYDRYVNR